MRGWVDAPRALLRGLDVLLLGLAGLAVVLAFGAEQGWRALAAGIVLVALYALGRRRVRVHERPVEERGSTWWPERAWMLALLLAWAAMVLATPGALWIAFPLMLLQLHVLGPRWGAGAVALTVAATVGFGLMRMPDGDGSVGYVIGPMIGGLVAIGFVVGLEAIVQQSQERQRALSDLAAAREHLADAERERVLAVERERMAREIHDTLAQGFSAVELLLRAAQDQPDRERATELVAQARAAAKENLAEARRVVRALAPGDLDGSTLLAALERVASRVEGVDVHVRVTGQARGLDVAVETALLRIVQSALGNVTQHAAASRGDVTLTYTEAQIMLDIVDDGRGFDPAAAVTSGGGYGLEAMRSRVRELGGTLAVETAPGEGTALAVTIPLGGTSEEEP